MEILNYKKDFKNYIFHKHFKICNLMVQNLNLRKIIASREVFDANGVAKVVLDYARNVFKEGLFFSF